MNTSIVSSTSTKAAGLSPYMQKVGKLMTLWEISEHLRLTRAQSQKKAGQS